MQVRSYQTFAELDAIKDEWNRLGEDGLFFVPSFFELRSQLEAEQCKFRLLVATDGSEIKALACFIYRNSAKFFHVGGKKLLRLPARVVTLFGSCVLGQPTESVVRDFFNVVVKDGDFDLIDVGYVFVDSPLYNALIDLPGAITWRAARKQHRWWLIRLPNSFENYFSSLRETARSHIARDGRRFARESPEFRVMQAPEQVDEFLRDAVAISQRTYQWKLGYSLHGDERTRKYLLHLAENGMLRCYVSYVKGQPCAYGWGDLSHGKFYFRQTGYDPRFGRLSPGTALMMYLIRDMIENTNCRVFHFQWGGEDGYKSRLATESHLCASMQVGRAGPYPIFLALLEQVVNLAKNAVGLLVERGPLKARLRSILRRLGVGTF